MVDEHITVDRIRMIEISLMTLVQRHVREISVIRVLLHENNVSRTDSLNDRLRNRRFPRACAAANSYNHSILVLCHSSLVSCVSFSSYNRTQIRV